MLASRQITVDQGYTRLLPSDVHVRASSVKDTLEKILHSHGIGLLFR